MVGGVTVHRLFRGEVIGRSQNFFFVREREWIIVRHFGESRESEIENLHHFGAIDQQVSWFDVAVNQSVLVSIVET